MILDSRSWGWAVAVGMAGAVLLVLMARGAIGHAVHYDELLHILSARGLLQTGQPSIADGFYTRAGYFTGAVAWAFRHFGDTPVSARLPALAAGAALAFLIGVWAVRKAGLLAGAAAAVLMCMVPSTVDVAVFARFYTVHAVLVALMFMLAFEAVQPGRAPATQVAALAAVTALIPLGWHFQDTTIIAVGALIASILALLALDHWTAVKQFVLTRPVAILGALGLCAISVLAAVWYVGLLDQLGNTALWAAGNATRHQYYLVEFRNDLPLLWPLLPVAAVYAVVRPEHRRLALFCSVAVASSLLVHSVASQKLLRYVYYLVPLMCVLWAIAVANLVTVIGRKVQGVGGADRHSPVFVLAMLATVFVLSQEGARALNLVAGRDVDSVNRPFAGEPDWTLLVAELDPYVRDADYVVTSNSMKAIYYLGRYDFELNATIVPETESRAEFGRDRRTGRQAIGTANSIQQVLERPAKTLVVIEASKIGRTSGVTTEAFSVIESRCEELKLLPEGSGVRAWWCVTRI